MLYSSGALGKKNEGMWLCQGTRIVLPRWRARRVVASFLVPYKRIDLILRAFNAMPKRRLLVLGDGQQERELKAMA